MREEITLDAGFFHKTLKPIADKLGWIIGYTATQGPNQRVIIKSVKVWSGGDHVNSGNFQDVTGAGTMINHLLSREQPGDFTSSHGPPVPASPGLAPPINVDVFNHFVRPFFQRIGWTVLHNLAGAKGVPAGAIAITGLIMADGRPCAPETAKAMVKEALPIHEVSAQGYDAEQAASASREIDESVAKLPEIRRRMEAARLITAFQEPETDQNWEEFDLKKLRQNPQNAERLAEYGERLLTVSGRHMVDTVRDAFARRGWRYGGTQYGNQTVAIHLVVDAAVGFVVSRADVEEALNSLHVPFESKSPVKLSKQAAADMQAERENFDLYLEEDEETGVDIIGETLEEAEEERKHAIESAMEHDEEQGIDAEDDTMEDVEEGQHIIQLDDEERLKVSLGWSHKAKRIHVGLSVGDNHILVGCNALQLESFLNGAEFLHRNIAEIKKQWEVGEGTESDADEVQKNTKQEEITEDGKTGGEERRSEEGESGERAGGDSD